MALQVGFDAIGVPLRLPRNAEGKMLFDGFALEPKNPITVTPNELTFTTVGSAVGSATITWQGNNFEVEDGKVVGGEVTSFIVKFGDRVFYEISDLKGIDAATLYSLEVGGLEDPADPFFDYIFQGDDVGIGTNLDDDNNGRSGNDIIFGRAGNDTLAGGIGQDQLFGGEGNDILIGVNPFATRDNNLNGTGLNADDTGEIDVLTGGNDRDTFVLGDSSTSTTYYLGQGDLDYAIIGDFEMQNDVFQLGSDPSNYQVNDYIINGQSKTGILFNGDLIAIVEGVTTSDLSQLGDFI
jgi:Ca2+-binding RTX toxin-like protein